jgi:hypothetical protein
MLAVRRFGVIGLVFIALNASLAGASSPVYDYKIIHVYPHDLVRLRQEWFMWTNTYTKARVEWGVRRSELSISKVASFTEARFFAGIFW